MDAIKVALRTLLAADAALTALVGDRIRPDELDEADALPACIIQIGEEKTLEDLADVSDAGTVTFGIACCAHTARQAGEIAAEVKRILAGYRGEVADLELDPITWQETQRDHAAADDDSDQDDWYYAIPLFEAFYRETA
jgi:hypothetical protein